jgi:hypothetical protein
MMLIISTSHGYVITDGMSFVKTFWTRHYESRQTCFYAAISSAALLENVWGLRNHQPIRGRIVRKAGIILKSVEQPTRKVQRNLL